MKNLFLLFAFSLCFAFSSGCVKSVVDPDRCDATLFNDEVNPQLMNWQEALNAYANDPTPANCAEYKRTGQAWLDAISSYADCSLIYTQSWREAVNEAKADLEAEDCQ